MSVLPDSGVVQLAKAIELVGTEIRYLGSGSADRSGEGLHAGWGAIEAHGDTIRQAGENIAAAILELAQAVRGDEVAA